MFHSQWQKKDASWKDLDKIFFTWTGDAASDPLHGCAIKLGEELNGSIPLTGPFELPVLLDC